MISALLIGFTLVLVSGVVRYLAMTTLHEHIVRLPLNRAAKAQLALLGLSLAHLLEAGAYAAGFRLGVTLGLGGFSGADASDVD